MIADRVDLNGDVGEGVGHDPELMAFVTSANIACGGHAGNDSVMRATVALARAHGVEVGAHPSLPDRDSFGRREFPLPRPELEACIVDQVRALAAIAAAEGVRVRHVKPHGALYNMAARDAEVADAVARATAAVDAGLILVGLAGSQLIAAGHRAGLRTAHEVFADRAYRQDGSLMPRHEPGAVLHDPAIVVPRAVAMVRDGAVTAAGGTRIPLQVDTICVHGDTPAAAALARQIRRALEEAGIRLTPLADL